MKRPTPSDPKCGTSRSGAQQTASRSSARSDPRAARTKVWAAIALITVVVLAAFWKLATMKGLIISDDLFGSDLMNENFPYRFSLGNALKAGHFPLWDRDIYGGFPLLARAESGVCYPFNLVIFGLFPPYVALNITILLTLLTAGIGMYFYTREIGSGQLPGVFGAIAFAFSGYLVAHLKHLSMANAASWLPVALTLLERAARRNHARPLLWFGVVFGLQHLAGNTQTAYYCGVLYLFYFAFRLVNRHRELRARSDHPNAARPLVGVLRSKLPWAFVAALALGSLLAAVQLIPTYEMVSLSQRSGGVTFEYASQYAYDLHDFWTFFYPYVNGDPGALTYTGSGIFWEDYGYVGALTLLFAGYAALRCWPSWHVKFFSLSAVISYLLVLGPNTPLYQYAFELIPGMSYFRFPTRLLLLTDMSLITLAALGLTKVAQQVAGISSSATADPGWGRASSRVRRSWLLSATGIALLIADLCYFQTRQNPIVETEKWTKPPQTAAIIQRDASLFRAYCVGGVHSHRRMVELAGGWEGSLDPFVEQREFLQPSSNVLYGIASPAGYANLIPNYIIDIWGDQNRAGIITRTASTRGGVFQPVPLFWKLMRMYNVKYMTSFWPFAPAPNLRTLGTYGGAHFYQNDDSLPRAYLVGDVVNASDREDALTVLSSDAFDPAQSVLLESALPNFRRTGNPSGSVEFLHYASNEAELTVQTLREAILVFSDSYYPGWVAKVDGHDTAIYRANITQRAVVVPAGEHRVLYQFKPTSVLVGFWVSLGALVVFLGCFLAQLVSTKRRADAAAVLREAE
jgi:Bacterial membrane protein YfhO